LLIWLKRAPPFPYCAEKSEVTTFTSPIASKIGVAITLLLIGEFWFAPSNSAVEKGMLPFAETPSMPTVDVFPVPDVPGSRMINCCQSGAPTWGSAVIASAISVCDFSELVVSSRGACSLTTTSEVVCPTASSIFKPTWPTRRVTGPRRSVEKPSFLKTSS
jgi:hypothetical protein